MDRPIFNNSSLPSKNPEVRWQKNLHDNFFCLLLSDTGTTFPGWCKAIKGTISSKTISFALKRRRNTLHQAMISQSFSPCDFRKRNVLGHLEDRCRAQAQHPISAIYVPVHEHLKFFQIRHHNTSIILAFSLYTQSRSISIN